MAWIRRTLNRSALVAAISLSTFAVPVGAQAASTYTVQPGDYLIGIAAHHGVSLGALLSANGLTVDSMIVPGMQLQIPAGESGGGGGNAGAGTYTVRPGDYLLGIARSHGVTLGALVSANGLTVDSMIHPGQQLQIPAGGTAPSGGSGSGSTGSSGGGSYTVRAGDTLFGIAQRHGVTLNALLAANNMTANSMIHPGTQVRLPDGASSSGGAATSAASGGAATSGQSYTVRPGDTLSGIADRYNVTLGALLTVNNMSANSMIRPGMQLALPAGAQVDARTARVDRVIDYALNQVGKQYRWFTRGPNTFDCSGLTLAAYAQVGITLVHHSATQARQGRAVDFWNAGIQAGDLIFLKLRGENQINHVGIATSSSTWVQARSPSIGITHGPIPSRGSIVEVRRFL